MVAETQRSCGGCTACCKALPVFEIHKPAGQQCPQCNEGVGCRIYSTRPKPCREFICQWLMGYGEDSERPDLIEIVPDYEEIEGLGKVFFLWEVSEGTLDGPHGQEMVKRAIHNEIPVCHIYCTGERKLYVPKGLNISERELQVHAGDNCHVFIVSSTPP